MPFLSCISNQFVVNAVRFYLGVGFSRGSGWLRRDHQSAGAVAPTAKLHNSVHVSRGSGMRREHHGDGGHNNCVGPAGAQPAGICRRARALAAAAAKPGLLRTETDSLKRLERHQQRITCRKPKSIFSSCWPSRLCVRKD